MYSTVKPSIKYTLDPNKPYLEEELQHVLPSKPNNIDLGLTN